MLTAITDYIQVARRKEPVLGQLGINRRSRLNPATSELDSQLMVSFLDLVSSAFSKLFEVEVDITSMRQSFQVVLVPNCVRKACTKHKLSWTVRKLLEAS